MELEDLLDGSYVEAQVGCDCMQPFYVFCWVGDSDRYVITNMFGEKLQSFATMCHFAGPLVTLSINVYPTLTSRLPW